MTLHTRLRDRPETYDIDPAKLEANFKNMQKVIHPDLFSSKSEVLCTCDASHKGGEGSVNKGVHHNQYCPQQTKEPHFKSCLPRNACCLDSHNQVKLMTGKNVLGEDDNYKVPMEVLMEVMEIR